MSFSFGVTGKDRAAAMVQVYAKMAEIVKQQPVHARDKAAVQDVCNMYLNLLDDAPEGWEYGLTVHGYVGWSGSVLDPKSTLTSANVSVTASYAKRV